MTEHPILGQVVLGYSPMIDRNRAVIATRLTLFPAKPDLALSSASLLATLNEVWPGAGGQVSLNIVSETLLHELLAAKLSTNLWIEVPAFMASDTTHSEALRRLHAQGNTLLIKGRPLQELPREVLPCFKYSIIDLSEERRGDAPPAPGVSRTISHVQSGVRTLEQMEQAFQRGAVAVLGWPVDDAIQSSSTRNASRPDMQTIVELIRRVDKEEPGDRLEATLKQDPTLAFKLMRYINSPAFGLRVEVSSFRHALMLLGYQRLKRWLALLLASASKDANMKPVMYAAVRRGLLMEELARSTQADEEMRNEMFICGVFSLLDKMMQQPFAELLKTIPVPERVYQALVDNSGPFQPYFDVVFAVEQESLFDIRAAADALMMSVTEINRAELRALANASQLD
ncbi:EAL and HDOD domain-containing protein [Ideonella sp. BN130291]|uniref:EAL and HDOD domain-containing protein n=1 Tax=Ideonella sp. BN130291 TaxID=3112940 RepID=UPI002E266D73|nr:HDOD domain-containing protein [Ideonella sp. BN130291]